MRPDEVKTEDGRYVSLSKLCGKQIVDVIGYIADPWDLKEPIFLMRQIILEDGTRLQCEGEHDAAYIHATGTRILPEELMAEIMAEEN